MGSRQLFAQFLTLPLKHRLMPSAPPEPDNQNCPKMSDHDDESEVRLLRNAREMGVSRWWCLPVDVEIHTNPPQVLPLPPRQVNPFTTT